jgi:hypothetical protein|tara:strand:- start:759 stop:1010 length:252 start_codon:yes stop_codon:yes gene_type:complete
MSKERFYTTLVCDLHEIANATTDAKTKEHLLNLWKNTSMYLAAKEAIGISYLHTEKTINESKTEISCLSSAKNLYEDIMSKPL